MKLLKVIETYRADTENEAKDEMEKFRASAAEKGYKIQKCGYTHKTKKAKGEIIDEAFIVSVTKEYNPIWEVLE